MRMLSQLNHWTAKIGSLVFRPAIEATTGVFASRALGRFVHPALGSMPAQVAMATGNVIVTEGALAYFGNDADVAAEWAIADLKKVGESYKDADADTRLEIEKSLRDSFGPDGAMATMALRTLREQTTPTSESEQQPWVANG